ncbi:MAG: CinA family nicotinamide mononucleotide deamidase-related protein [Chloroflexi bacterium]|nr:CinA family nicotinamide mononucleotide deamidase-related protein [Chloroflexota bacterium]
MRAEIISIGTELLMGEIVDTNSAYLASQLARLGIELRWVTKVGDDPERLFEALERAFRRSDVTLTSGGLGPTSDDLTRESIARVFGEQMEVKNDLLEHLKSLFAGRGTPMPETNIKQATLIPSAQAIPNPMGTAPGWWAERNSHVIVAMPGPPRELERMWTHEVAPRLKERNPGVAIVTRTIKTFGISEGGLDQMLTPLFKSVNPYLGIYSKQDGIHLRAIATAPTEEEARLLIAPMEARIRQVAGYAIWGLDDETAESQVASLLSEKGRTLGVMECFTGGLIASNLADIEGSQAFLGGSLVIHGDGLLADYGVDAQVIEEHGPASAQTAEAMADAARRLFNADYGLSVTGLVTTPTPTSGPVGTSHIGFAADGRTASMSGRYPTQRLRIRSRAATHALLGLIRMIKGLDPHIEQWRR